MVWHAQATPEEWLRNKGSVGKSRQGKAHIVNDNSSELPTGKAGTVHFENLQMNFQYHNVPKKARVAMLHGTWATTATWAIPTTTVICSWWVGTPA